MGEWVDPDAPAVKATRTSASPEDSSRSWVGSSYDLLGGAEVNDDPDTVPDSLIDEFFPSEGSADRSAER
jgi:hypothetical protein